MRLRTIRAATAGLAVAATAVIAGPAVAAHATGESCDASPKTVVTHLVNRLDSGNHGDWALDTMKRTTKITTSDSDDDKSQWSYHAEVTDEGTFVTKVGDKLSPNKGDALAAGVTGTLKGGFTADFTADACFASFKDNFDGNTYNDQGTSTAPAPSSEWVASVWGDKDAITAADGSTLEDKWSWKYETCGGNGESWLDAYNNNSGKDEGAGDITGKACPTPTPTPTTPAGGNGGGSGSTPTSSTSSTATASLPVTGASTGVLVGIAVVFVGAGAGLFVVGRRRRNTFTA